MSVQPRLLETVRRDGTPVLLEEHRRRYGPLPVAAADALAASVSEAGLTGRGGAAFPTGAKLDAVRTGRGTPVLVANGAEGEPASGKDKVLLAHVPHLVLDGVVAAARAIGATEAIVAATHVVAAQARTAIAERRDKGVRIRLVLVPDRFIAGEETALVNFLNGGRAVPTLTPPRPFERGVNGAPTLVLNVETLAQIALIARHGATWFRSVGTSDEPGTVLVTVSGAARNPGVFEVALGSPLVDLLSDAGVDVDEIQALLVGGYFGGWLAAPDAVDANVSNADLGRVRASLGARAIVALPKTACGVAETARVARYLARESAGQCGPCVHGLAAVATSLEQLARRDRRLDEAGLLRRRMTQIAGRGACRHPDGAIGLVASALRVFAPEFQRHADGKRCAGGARNVLPIPAEPATAA